MRQTISDASQRGCMYESPLPGSPRTAQTFKNARLRFILTQLNTAERFADTALESDEDEKKSRNRQNARKGYDACFLAAGMLTPDDNGGITSKITSLKSKLQELGETF